MAVPSYTTDLNNINTTESTTGWGELQGHTGGSAALITKNSCSFIDMSTFIYQSNTTADFCSWRGCGQITGAGATMSSTPGSSPTGTITSTFVILNGSTDINGEISMNRVFSSDQNFNGWARKTSGSPYYKTGLVSGTVSSSTGATPIALMIKDE